LALTVLLSCEAPTSAPPASTTPAAVADASAPDLALLLVAGLRSAGDGAEAAFWTAMGRAPDRRFANAYAQASAPFTSLGSMLTGRYVAGIPMCGRLLTGDRSATEDKQAWCAQIPDELHTLPEVLGLYGYQTALVTTAVPGAADLADGFNDHRTADSWTAAVAEAEAWWSGHAATPRLLVVVLGDDGETVLGRPDLPRFPERKLQWLEPISGDLTRGTIDPASAREAYRAGAADAGRTLGEILAHVHGGSDRPAWTIAASTSGMSLTERSGFHGSQVPLLTDNLLLERTVHVPLGIFAPTPTGTPTVVEPVVELVDIFSTMAKWAGAVVPAGVWGMDLQTERGDGGRAYAEFGDMLLVREGPHVSVFRCTLHNATSLDPGITTRLLDDRAALPADFYSLHDVVADPWQATDIRSEKPAVFQALRARLIEMRTGPAAVPSGAVSPERLWALRMAPSDGYW
jgi:arylsulfatase A-like enzyme